MRMRKKKHTSERMEACADILIKNPSEQKGKWRSTANGKRINIEIGCGKGGFITELAKRKSDEFFIAFEKVTDVLVMAMEKAKSNGITNIRFSDADAETLCEIFDDGEVDDIYLNFSDPWPKAKHAKRRLTYRTYLEKYKKILGDDGKIFFKTDNRPLFDFSLEEFALADLNIGELTFDLHNSEYNENNIETEYEKTFSARGFSINRAVLTKKLEK